MNEEVMTRAEYEAKYGQPVPSPESTQGYSVRSALAQALSGAAEGAANTLGFARDILPSFLGGDPNGNPIRDSLLTGQPVHFRNVDLLQDAIKPIVAEPDPQYRYSRRAGDFVGGSVVTPGGAGPRALVSALLGGLTSQAAEDVTGDKTIAPLVGGVLGGVAPGGIADTAGMVRSYFRGATPQEVKGSAAMALRELSDLQPDDFAKAAASAPNDELGRFMTTAELTDNAGIAQIEKTLSAADEPARLYNERMTLRNEARDRILDSMSGAAGVNREGLGTKLTEAALQTQDDMQKTANRLWSGLDRSTPISIAREQRSVRAILKNRMAGLQPGSKVQTLVRQFTDKTAGTTRPAGALQDIRSDALMLLREGKLSPVEERILSTLDRGIDSAMSKGLTGEQYDMWSMGRAVTRQEKQLFGKGSAAASLVDPQARPSNVISNAIRGDARSIKEIRAAVRESPELMEQLKRGVLDMIPRDANNEVTAAGLRRFISANEGSLRELFGSDHYSQMNRILQDLRSQNRVGRIAFRASDKGSWTAQRGTVAGAIQETMLGALVPGSGTLSVLANQVKRAVGIRNDKAVQELLFRAAMDPQFAAQLAATPSRIRIKTALERLREMFGSASGTSARLGFVSLTTGGREQSMPQRQQATDSSVRGMR